MNEFKRKFLAAAILLGIACSAFGQAGQAVITRGESATPGIFETTRSTNNALHVRIDSLTPAGAIDPCASSAIAKSSAIINVVAAATTQLVAISGSTVIYVCAVDLTISQVITTANTLRFVYGTGASCGTGTTNLTGDFGAGGVTAGPPIVINFAGTGTRFKTIAGQALCVTTAIGGSGTFQGVVTYVQQ